MHKLSTENLYINMKKLSLYIFLVLMWCNVSQAGSIKDYEKGGMKLGKSLLIEEVLKFEIVFSC